ncbi:hypothetical protein B0A49_00938 [Cryomyces minteri]|uniref:BCD1 alpha/beta domain-containing protein n=1 Tax=Cryomyces minteri TaxID=331657 RepID=A0A4U0Y0B4_9PEZI|nr:hypothetical protein B0A49_00938 [Cryomyces minteri]
MESVSVQKENRTSRTNDRSVGEDKAEAEVSSPQPVMDKAIGTKAEVPSKEETTQVMMPSVTNEPQPEHHSEKDANAAEPAGAAADVFFIDTVPEPPEPHFYLVKPYTSTSRRVLIPLSSSATLADSLRGQVVLEFPTIQLLPHPSHALPSNFMLEAEYLGESKREEQELDELLKHVQPLGDEGEGVGGGAGSDVVPDREIIEMLRKDVGGGL